MVIILFIWIREYRKPETDISEPGIPSRIMQVSNVKINKPVNVGINKIIIGQVDIIINIQGHCILQFKSHPGEQRPGKA